MKLISAFVVVTLCLSLQVFAVGGNKSQPSLPKKNEHKDPREGLEDEIDEVVERAKVARRAVIGELRQKPEEEIEEVVVRTTREKVAGMRAILPGWCRQVPDSILLYLDFSTGDSKLQRAYKLFHMALFVRDMYEDLDINYNTFVTLPKMMDDRLTDRVRYWYVGRALLEAYVVLDAYREETQSRVEDELASLMEIGYWGVYYSNIAKMRDTAFKAQLESMHQLASVVLSEDPRPLVIKHAQDLFDVTQEEAALAKVAPSLKTIAIKLLAPVLH